MSIDIKDEDGNFLHLGTHPSNTILIMDIQDKEGDNIVRWDRSKESNREELQRLILFLTDWLKVGAD